MKFSFLIFAQLPAALFWKLAMSHSATEQEGRDEPAGRIRDSANHRMQKGRSVGSKKAESGRRMFWQKGEIIEEERERAQRLRLTIWVWIEWLGLELRDTEKGTK